MKLDVKIACYSVLQGSLMKWVKSLFRNMFFLLLTSSSLIRKEKERKYCSLITRLGIFHKVLFLNSLETSFLFQAKPTSVI